MIVTTHTFFVKKPTPLLNTPDFRFSFGGENGDRLNVDEKGLIRSVETILFPGTKLTLIDQTSYPHIVEVSTREYPYSERYYVDERFLVETDEYAQERPIRVPHLDTLLRELYFLEGSLYIWGGNWPEGIPELLKFYPPAFPLEERIRSLWMLKGVDCSGLLYKVTQGYTPRNTSSLLHFGRGLPIADLSIDEMVSLVKPLDLIVWMGHVVCVLDDKKTIESILNPGRVVICDLKTRLEEICSERKPVNIYEKESFVIRRWL